jgi:[NiFe] hydrogenase diaphorase moiety small subunit
MSGQFMLDGQAVPFEDGQTILQAARPPGATSPTCAGIRISAARIVQAVHREGGRPACLGLHAAGERRHGGRERHAGDQRRAPHLLQMLFVEGNHFLPVVREERQLPAAGAGLRTRDVQRALQPLLPDPAGRCVPPRHPARLQSLHLLRAVRARQPRRGRQEHLRADQSRHPQAPGGERRVGPLGDTDFSADDLGRQHLPGRRDPAGSGSVSGFRSASASTTASPSAGVDGGRE